MRKRFGLVAALMLAGCASVQDAGVARLGDAPALGGGSYDSGGGLTVAADLREQDGFAVVCGVWAQSLQQSVLTKGAETRVLGSGAVFVGDRAAVRGLVFMNEVAPAQSYAGAMANCVQTEVPWTEGDTATQVTIRIPRQVVYRDADDDGVIEVYFEPTGPGAGEPALLGTIIYSVYEDWTVLESLYFCVMTLTTIGYGDYTPTDSTMQAYTIFYALLGIGFFVAFTGKVVAVALSLREADDANGD